MRREHIRIGGLSIAALCIFAAGYLYVMDQQPAVVRPSTPAGATDVRHPLVKEQGVGVIYKFNQDTQDALISAVDQFCVKNYERESCLHHFATCGHPCLVVIPKDKRKRIVDDYKVLRKARGLPDLMPLPQDD